MNNLAHKEPVMMRGSSGGLDYRLFAHKGRFGVGFKMLGMAPGAAQGVPDTVYYAIRVRAAKLPEDVYKEITEGSTVTSFADPDAFPSNVFPSITFDKNSNSRSSSIVAGYFAPDFKLDEEKKIVGADDIRNGKARQQFLEWMKKSVEDGAIQIMSDDEVLEIMDQFEQMVIKKVWESLLGEAISSEEKQASVGVISSQNDLAVKIKKKMQEIDPTLAAAQDQEETVKGKASDEIIDPDFGGDDQETGVDEDED